jgi:hypothetical protein
MTVTAPTMGFDIGRVAGRLFGLVGRNLGLFLGLAALLVGVPGAMVAVAQIGFMSDMLNVQAQSDPSTLFANAFSPLRIGIGLAGGLISIVGNAALQGSVIYASVSDLSGKRVGFGDAIGTGLRYFLPLFCIGLIVGICCFFGYLIFIVPGVLLGLAWCVAAPAEVVERTGIFGALSRSADLTRNHRGAIFALVIIFAVAVFVVQMVMNAIGQIAFGLSGSLSGGVGAGSLPPGLRNMITAQSLVAVVMQVVIASLASAGLASVYFELRQIKEGVGAEQLAAVFD